jgi:hypothetical protein
LLNTLDAHQALGGLEHMPNLLRIHSDLEVHFQALAHRKGQPIARVAEHSAKATTVVMNVAFYDSEAFKEAEFARILALWTPPTMASEVPHPPTTLIFIFRAFDPLATSPVPARVLTGEPSQRSFGGSLTPRAPRQPPSPFGTYCILRDAITIASEFPEVTVTLVGTEHRPTGAAPALTGHEHPDFATLLEDAIATRRATHR